MKTVVSSACLFVVSGCLSADLSVPQDAVIVCETQDDCPAGFVCSTGLERCIDESMQDSVPPAFVAGTFSVTPLAARVGTEITVTFEVTEELAELPVVKLGDPGPEFTLKAGRPPEYVFTYTVTGDEAEDDIPISVHLIDWGGNQTTLGGMTVTLDFTAPVVVSPTLTPSTVNVGQTVTVEFTASEELGRLPDVVWITALPEAFTYDSSATDYTFTLDTTGLTAGQANVRITVTDVAGNAAEELIGPLTVEP